MKKILAIAIVAVMAIALCVSASASSFDRLFINENVLAGTDHKGDDPVEIAVGDKLYMLGWSNVAGGLKEIVYTIDGKEYKCEANYRDRTAELTSAGVQFADGDNTVNCGIGKDDAAFELTGIDKLKDGTYELEVFEVSYSGEKQSFKKFNLKVGTGVKAAPASDVKPVKVELSSEATSGVTAEVKDGKLVCTTTDTSDPWVSIPVDIDTSVYKYFTVTYTATQEIGSNNTYMKTTGYLGAPDGGDWEPHGMKDTADGKTHSVTYNIPESFATFADTQITGIRLTCCGTVDGVFTIESIVFHATETIEEGSSNPGTADAAVIAIAAVACIALAGVVVAKKVK